MGHGIKFVLENMSSIETHSGQVSSSRLFVKAMCSERCNCNQTRDRMILEIWEAVKCLEKILKKKHGFQ